MGLLLLTSFIFKVFEKDSYAHVMHFILPFPVQTVLHSLTADMHRSTAYGSFEFCERQLNTKGGKL